MGQWHRHGEEVLENTHRILRGWQYLPMSRGEADCLRPPGIRMVLAPNLSGLRWYSPICPRQMHGIPPISCFTIARVGLVANSSWSFLIWPLRSPFWFFNCWIAASASLALSWTVGISAAASRMSNLLSSILSSLFVCSWMIFMYLANGAIFFKLSTTLFSWARWLIESILLSKESLRV